MDTLIVAKQNQLGLKMAQKLEKELTKKFRSHIADCSIQFDPSTAKRLKKRGMSIKKFSGDMLITVGGDGTMLWASHQTNVPILPVKIEGHGFLCTVDFESLLKNLDKLITKEYTVTERLRIKCNKIKYDRIEKYFSRIFPRIYPMSLNEIVFARKRPSKILNVEFVIDDVAFRFSGDGLMFSTPSGSTAYSLSAGGSIIDPSLDVITITPLYPFFSNIKPMVIPASKQIILKVTAGDCSIIVDGHGGEYVKADSEFLIEKGEPLKVINLEEHNFYKKFRTQFLQGQ
ncbi:MAG: NAD(+)/NADH kinase [Candidatus Aenigmarchaeota archaeon]|nr:NAD(+)/NADH kinase [Candidatus Aenigmarchaeota archaeon]